MAKQKLYVAGEGALYQGGSGNDTIANFTGKFSANTVKGGAGNDLISFAHQTTSIVVTATNGGTAYGGTAGTTTIGFNTPVISGGSVQTKGEQSIAFDKVGTTAGTVTFASLRNTALLTGNKSYIQGGEGNDTVEFGDYLVSVSGVTVEGGKGNDLIGSYNSGASTAGKFNTKFVGNNFRGAKGNDVVNVDVSALSAKKFKLNGNSGDDTVIFSSLADVAVSGVSGEIYGGKGNDNITVINSAGTFTHMTIGGGVGNDTVALRASATFASGVVKLDASNADSGKDTITVDLGTWSGSSILGYNGVDSIVLSALDTDGGKNYIDGGRGNDLIEFSTATFSVSGSTIAGGKGDDVINNSGSEAATNGQDLQSSVIRMGAGKDTLVLSASVETAGADGLTIVGGAGADALTVQGIGTAGSGTFAFESYTDSKLGSGDTVTFQSGTFTKQATTQNSAHVNFTIPDTVALASGSQTAVGNGVSGVSGVINFSGVGDNLTARVNALDSSFTTTGTVAVFTVQDNNEFLFVQGGTNDLVIKINDSTVMSAGAKDGTLALTYSGKAFGFAG